MAQIPPTPVFPQAPIAPIAGSHTSTQQGNLLAQSVNTTLSQTQAYLGNSGNYQDMSSSQDFGTSYQNTQSCPVFIRAIATSSSGGTIEGWTSTDPTNQTPFTTGDLVDSNSTTTTGIAATCSIWFTVKPNCWYYVHTDGPTKVRYIIFYSS